MKSSLFINDVALAIRTVQNMKLRAKRDEQGEDGKRFASYASVLKTLREPWEDEGLTVVQFSGVSDVTTVIMHVTGQFIAAKTSCEMRADGSRAYGPRHALMLAFGVVEAKEKKPKKAIDLGGGFTSVRTPKGFPFTISQRVEKAFLEHGLNAGQMGLILSRDVSEDEMIAEAVRLGGKR